MTHGNDLIAELERQIESYRKAISNRIDRINDGVTDWDDCFISQRCEERGITEAEDKIRLIQDGGLAWFTEYATLDGTLVDAMWCETRYGSKLRVKMPDGSVIWTTATTKKGLEKKGLKLVDCRRPAWYKFHSSQRGMLGVYTGSYILFPSRVNYATGEEALEEPVEIREHEWKESC